MASRLENPGQADVLFNAKSIVGEVKLGVRYSKSKGTPRGAILSMYGSILKFSPKGGMIEHHPGGTDRGKKVATPYTGKPTLDP